MNDGASKKMWDYYQTECRQTFDSVQSRSDLVYSLLRKAVPKGGAILEIGFGNGYLLRKLHGNAYRCYGADIAPKNIAACREAFGEAGRGITLSEGAITRLPFADALFDAVVAIEVLEHITGTDTPRALSEVFRCLKKGGVFIATVPADENLADNRCCCPNCNTAFHRWGHQQSFSESRIRKIFGETLPGARCAVRRTTFRDARLTLAGKLIDAFRKAKLLLGLPASEAHYVVTAVKP